MVNFSVAAQNIQLNSTKCQNKGQRTYPYIFDKMIGFIFPKELKFAVIFFLRFYPIPSQICEFHLSSNCFHNINKVVCTTAGVQKRPHSFNPIQDGLFRGCSRMGGGLFGPPSLKSAGQILQWWNLAQFYLYLRKIKRMYKSRDTPLGFCWHQYFFTGNHQILLHQEIHI